MSRRASRSLEPGAWSPEPGWSSMHKLEETDAGVLEVLNGVMLENLSTSLQITDRHRIVISGHVVTARWRLKARAVTAVGCSG